MSLRVEAHSRLTISNDNSASPTDIVYGPGDKSFVDSSTYNEGTSKVLQLPPSTVNQAVNLDAIVSVAALQVLAEGTQVSVTLVPTGKTLGDCSALKLLPGFPLVIGSDIAAIYLSNADTLNAAKVHVGAAGN